MTEDCQSEQSVKAVWAIDSMRQKSNPTLPRNGAQQILSPIDAQQHSHPSTSEPLIYCYNSSSSNWLWWFTPPVPTIHPPKLSRSFCGVVGRIASAVSLRCTRSFTSPIFIDSTLNRG
ncbi:hypothetical protein DAPPUDRAFT_234040 [Daphnia pulex]|uniref:Uncharacterized protein n=1 Tax=Daphnia pulex TaxID=6669 RepID=E9FUE7_DAPPU|nr:hypothetical protein DAPPUDRAFT_234040 [Daphnia pulex]|eukprot:EFX88714.1 hypothetical protein DAPPUDRAFT_234040 [Daphnia pulex]